MIAGICKAWNEADIIVDTLNHNMQWCDHIYLYDDCSDDGTADLASELDYVTVVRGTERHPHRPNAQGGLLQVILEAAMKDSPDWIFQFDADEHVYPDDINLMEHDAVRMKLYEYYITPADEHLPYTERTWIGPEYRNILMMYRPFPGMAYGWRDQREMWGLPKQYRTQMGGYVKHYGKAISVERWERQCDYYANNFPEPYRTKWAERRGKAVHTSYESDFGRPLISWEQKDKLGVLI